MTSSPIQSLYVLTDSVCAYAIDLLHEGATSETALVDAIVDRLGISAARAKAVLDGLVETGFASRTSLDAVSDSGFDRYADLVEEAIAHVGSLEHAGEVEHARDIIGAIDAAFNGRSREPRLRWAAALFHDSDAGRRHAARVADGTLGVLASQPAVV